jgi:hypothetical protein
MSRVEEDRQRLAEWLEYAETLKAQVEPKGRAHGGLYMAVSIARTSLDLGKPRNITDTLQTVSTLVAYVNGIAAREKEVMPRHAGGKKTGTARAKKTAERWTKYEEMFAALADGKEKAERLKARKLVEKQMVDDGFVDPVTKEFPTRQTLARHFRTKFCKTS